MRATRYSIGVGSAVLAGLLVRVGYLVYYADVAGNPASTGDAWHYHNLANMLADGDGFIEPSLAMVGHSVQAASHPPLYSAVLALVSMFGMTAVGAHQAVSVLLGLATIGVVGLLGRAVGSERVGMLAAWLAALYPPMWIHDALVLSETLAILVAAAAALAAYRYVEEPSDRGLARLGVLIGLAALARSENVLLWGLLLVPVAVRAARASQQHLLRALAVGTVGMLVALLPWAAYNATRFDRPVLLSDQLGVTLLMANCDPTYQGDLVGYWNLQCAAGTFDDADADRSVRDAELRTLALEYIGDNLASVPRVALVRAARVWGVYEPADQIRIDVGASSRELRTTQLAFVASFAGVYLAVCGVVLLRRRGVLVLPLVALPVLVTVTAMLTYGNPRFRAVAEVAIVVLAAVALDEGLLRRQARQAESGPARRRRPAAVDAPA